MRAGSRAALGAAAIMLVAVMAGCTVPPWVADSGASGRTPPSEAGSETATLLAVVDGDTIETSAGTVRLIGIDTPERGECGHDRAAGVFTDMVSPGDPLVLELPAGQNDRDRHGRLLRYAETEAGVDLGLLQLEAGTAVARYDSVDGYPAHPREDEYHAAQVATLDAGGAVVAVDCADAAAPLLGDDPWWEAFPSCAKLRQNDLGLPVGPFDRDDPAQAELYDWFANRTGNNGDGDGDGLACE